MMGDVIGELNNIKQIMLFSDRCTPKDTEKMDVDYERDLAKCLSHTKARLVRYLKGAVKKAPDDAPPNGSEQPADQKPVSEVQES